MQRSCSLLQKNLSSEACKYLAGFDACSHSTPHTFTFVTLKTILAVDEDKCWHDLSSPLWCTNKNKSCLKDKLHHPCGNPWSTCFYYNSWGNSRASIWDGLNFRDSLFPMLVCGDSSHQDTDFELKWKCMESGIEHHPETRRGNCGLQPLSNARTQPWLLIFSHRWEWAVSAVIKRNNPEMELRSQNSYSSPIVEGLCKKPRGELESCWCSPLLMRIPADLTASWQQHWKSGAELMSTQKPWSMYGWTSFKYTIMEQQQGGEFPKAWIGTIHHASSPIEKPGYIYSCKSKVFLAGSWTPKISHLSQPYSRCTWPIITFIDGESCSRSAVSNSGWSWIWSGAA